ncbi:uncharacterized protein LOC141929579 isoform X1 [Strix aluco]|uniref:uncharacterized protein LOC141929579 isoform X1 n=1 Tax=Strix aluco TaxID=111821 RepID=UPI003DA27320
MPSPRDEDIAQLAAAKGRGPQRVPRHRAWRSQPLSAFFPFSSPLSGFWQRSGSSDWGTRCRGRSAKRRQPPAAPRPPVPRLVAGRRAACAWRGSVSCGRIPAPRSLPISLRAGTTGGSGGTGGEGCGGWIVKGREEGKKKKKKENNGHMPSLERRGCRCQNASRQRGAKTHRRQRGASGSPSQCGTHGGRAARQRHDVAEVGQVADGGAGEERGGSIPLCRGVTSGQGAVGDARWSLIQHAATIPPRIASLGCTHSTGASWYREKIPAGPARIPSLWALPSSGDEATLDGAAPSPTLDATVPATPAVGRSCRGTRDVVDGGLPALWTLLGCTNNCWALKLLGRGDGDTPADPPAASPGTCPGEGGLSIQRFIHPNTSTRGALPNTLRPCRLPRGVRIQPGEENRAPSHASDHGDTEADGGITQRDLHGLTKGCTGSCSAPLGHRQSSPQPYCPVSRGCPGAAAPAPALTGSSGCAGLGSPSTPPPLGQELGWEIL